jgi:hypothetical protein
MEPTMPRATLLGLLRWCAAAGSSRVDYPLRANKGREDACSGREHVYQLERALAFYREVGTTAAIKEGEALLAPAS